MIVPENDPIEFVGGYGGILSTTRADEVVKLFELSAKHNLPFDPTELYCDLIRIVYNRAVNVEPKPKN